MEKGGARPLLFSAANGSWPLGRIEGYCASFLTKTQEQWCEIMEGSDVCFAPVLNLIDAANHPHNKARNVIKPWGHAATITCTEIFAHPSGRDRYLGCP